MNARETGATNARPLDETIAGTGPGIADDALGAGEDMPEAPTDAEVGAVARAIGAPVPEAAGLAASPGDVAPAGTPGTGENVCPACNGSGHAGDGAACPNCDGTGTVVEGVGGG